MASRAKAALSLLTLANRIEAACVLEYGYAARASTAVHCRGKHQSRAPLSNGISGGETAPADMTHLQALRLVSDLRQAALDCAEGIIDRPRAITLLERALDLGFALPDVQISQSIIDFIQIYRPRPRTARRHVNKDDQI